MTLLEEIEVNEKIKSILSLEEIPYVFRNPKLKEEKLKKLEEAEKYLENLQLNHETKVEQQQILYASKFVLGLREGNNYLENLAAGGIGFILGVLANDGFRNYLNGIAKEAISEFKYSKS